MAYIEIQLVFLLQNLYENKLNNWTNNKYFGFYLHGSYIIHNMI